MLDQNLAVAKAGPTGSAATEYSGALDLGGASAGLGKGNLTGRLRLKLELPAITGLDSGKTITYTLEGSVDSAFTSPIDLSIYYPAKVQTGTGGAAADYYFDARPELPRYIRVKAVTASSPGTITAYTYKLWAVLGNQPGL